MHRGIFLALLAPAFFSTAVAAQTTIFKCTVHGQTVYTDRPCAPSPRTQATASDGVYDSRGSDLREIDLGTLGGQHLTAKVPGGWHADPPQQTGNAATTIRLVQGSRPDAILLVTVMQPPPGSSFDASNPKAIREIVEHSAAKAEATSTEAHLQVKAFNAGAVRGAYFSAVDKAPEPGGFKFMSEGVASLGKLVVQSTVLSNQDPAGYRQKMFLVAGSLHASPEHAATQDDENCGVLTGFAGKAMDARQGGMQEATLMRLEDQVCESKTGDDGENCRAATTAMKAIVRAAYQEPLQSSDADKQRATTAFQDKISRLCVHPTSSP